VCGGLVEDQDGGVCQERPGERDPAALAAREVRSLFADERVESLGERFDEPPDARAPKGLLDGIVVCRRPGKPNVLPNVGGEEVGVLSTCPRPAVERSPDPNPSRTWTLPVACLRRAAPTSPMTATCAP
jgi:hypothetical protein